MKDFDVVKFTMWLGVVLLVAVLGGHWWVKSQLDEEETRLRTMKSWLQDIGKLSGEIRFLEDEMRADKFSRYEDTPLTFFQMCASQAGIDANRDYTLDPKDPDVLQGFQDTRFILTMKKDRELNRRSLARMCYAVETNSPRVKLVSLKLQLEHNDAEEDLWKATLEFLRRDPISN